MLARWHARGCVGQVMQLDIPPGPFAGYIFDLDGTLIDSMPVHYRAWDAAMHQFGLREPLDENFFYSLGGVPTLQVAALIAERYGLQADPQAVFHVKEQLFVELLSHAPLIEPTVAFLRSVAATTPCAVASGGPRAIVHHSLRLSGLAGYFRAIVSADDVVHGKPAPDMFLLAASILHVPADQCLVFEDAEPGMRAARAAGMQVVHVPSRR